MRNAAMMLMTGYKHPNIVCDAAQFDGANDWLSKASDLSGVSDSATGILSCWLRIDGGDSTAQTLMRGGPLDTTSGFLFNRPVNNRPQVVGWDNANNNTLAVGTGSTFTTSATWIHFLSAWKRSVTTAQFVYINGVDETTDGGAGTGNIQYTPGQWTIGADVGGIRKCNMAIAEFYFAPGQFLDFSNTYFREKFRSLAGKPVHLGTN